MPVVASGAAHVVLGLYLRGAGVQTGGPEALGNADRKKFADQLDRFLAKQGKG